MVLISEKFHPPRRTGTCPNCQLGTAHERVTHAVRFWPKTEEIDPFDSEDDPPTQLDLMTYTGWTIYRCTSCRKTFMYLVHHRARVDREAIERGVGPGLPFREEVTEVMVWPAHKPRELPDEAPDGLRSLFAEAAVCEAAESMRAAGVMYRATVEELVQDQGATGRDLHARIESLSSTLKPDLVAALHEARMLGNDSIHAGITYSAEEVADVAELIDEAVTLLYVQPAQRQRMREQRRVRRETGKTGGSTDQG